MAISLALSFLIWKLFRLEKRMIYVLLLCGFFGNITFLGFPFAELLFGTSSLPITSVYVSVYNLIIFAVLLPLIYMHLGKEGAIDGIEKTLLNPIVACTITGAIIVLLHIDVSAAMPYLAAFSSLTTPLSLVAMGMFLSKDFILTFDRNMATLAISKCLIFPAITAALLVITGNWGQGREMLMLSLMPVAISNFVIADSLELDLGGLVLGSIVLTSAISIAEVFILVLAGVF